MNDDLGSQSWGEQVDRKKCTRTHYSGRLLRVWKGPLCALDDAALSDCRRLDVGMWFIVPPRLAASPGKALTSQAAEQVEAEDSAEPCCRLAKWLPA